MGSDQMGSAVTDATCLPALRARNGVLVLLQDFVSVEDGRSRWFRFVGLRLRSGACGAGQVQPRHRGRGGVAPRVRRFSGGAGRLGVQQKRLADRDDGSQRCRLASRRTWVCSLIRTIVTGPVAAALAWGSRVRAVLGRRPGRARTGAPNLALYEPKPADGRRSVRSERCAGQDPTRWVPDVDDLRTSSRLLVP